MKVYVTDKPVGIWMISKDEVLGMGLVDDVEEFRSKVSGQKLMLDVEEENMAKAKEIFGIIEDSEKIDFGSVKLALGDVVVQLLDHEEIPFRVFEVIKNDFEGSFDSPEEGQVISFMAFLRRKRKT